jgi:hypothetical protein
MFGSSTATYITTLCFESNVYYNIMLGTIKQRILQHYTWYNKTMYITTLCLVSVKQRLLQHYISKTTYITTFSLVPVKQRILQHYTWYNKTVFITTLCLVPVKQRILQHYVPKATYITTLCFESNVYYNI